MERTKLIDLGFKEAAQSLGSLQTFKTTKERILSGELLDETLPIPDEARIASEIGILNDKLDNITQKRGEKINRQKVVKENIIEVHSKLDKLSKNPKDVTVIGPNGPFNSVKFYSTLLVFIGLSLFLLYYYVGVPYMSFVKECDATTAMFPDFNTWLFGVSNNLPLLLFPLVFFAFGISLHIALDFKKKSLRLSIIAILILITFILDLRMAIQIHECLDTNHYLSTGEHLPRWYESGLVYILFILGFVLFFLWSFIYHFLIKEFGKKNLVQSLQQSLQDFKGELLEIETSLTTSEGHLSRLKNRKRILEGGNFITEEMINESSRLYKSGFLKFLNAGGDNYQHIITELDKY